MRNTLFLKPKQNVMQCFLCVFNLASQCHPLVRDKPNEIIQLVELISSDHHRFLSRFKDSDLAAERDWNAKEKKHTHKQLSQKEHTTWLGKFIPTLLPFLASWACSSTLPVFPVLYLFIHLLWLYTLWSWPPTPSFTTYLTSFLHSLLLLLLTHTSFHSILLLSSNFIHSLPLSSNSNSSLSQLISRSPNISPPQAYFLRDPTFSASLAKNCLDLIFILFNLFLRIKLSSPIATWLLGCSFSRDSSWESTAACITTKTQDQRHSSQIIYIYIYTMYV